MQVKLLRLIESGTFRRVGSVETMRADFRLVAATHKPLLEMVSDGRFRQDLFYRLNVIDITIAPLRERTEDLPALCQALLSRIAFESGQPAPPMLSGHFPIVASISASFSFLISWDFINSLLSRKQSAYRS